MLTENEKDNLNVACDTLLAIEDTVHIIARKRHNPWLYRAIVRIECAREQIKKAVKNADSE